MQSSACHSEIPKLSVGVSAAVPAQDRIKPGTISNEYALHYFYYIGFLLTDGFTGVARCEEIPLPDTDMRERITAEGANVLSAQVQVYGTAFLSTFDALFIANGLSWHEQRQTSRIPLYLEIRESMASSLLRSLPSLLFEWLCRSGMLPLIILFHHRGYSSAVCCSSPDDYAEKVKPLKAVTCLIVEVINLHSGR